MSSAQLPQRIRQVMNEMKISQNQLSDILGISQPAISLYLKGRMPPADVLYRIARLAHTSVEWLLSGTEGTPPAAVHEKSAVYGREAALLELWRKLSPPLQNDILNLLRHIGKVSGNTE
jgi:transcriptional regulator with XRE-family HTH domain